MILLRGTLFGKSGNFPFTCLRIHLKSVVGKPADVPLTTLTKISVLLLQIL